MRGQGGGQGSRAASRCLGTTQGADLAFSLLKAPTNSHSPGTVKLREGSLTALFTSHGHLYLLRPREGARPGGVGSPGEGVGVGGDIAGHARVLVPVPGAAHP